MSKEDLRQHIQKGGPDISKAARQAEKARAAAVAVAAAAVLSTANAQAQENQNKDPQITGTEHVINAENSGRAQQPQEGDISYSDYAQTTAPENKETVVEQLGLYVGVDENGNAAIVSESEMGTSAVIEPERAGRLKREYKKDQKEAFKAEGAGEVHKETVTYDEAKEKAEENGGGVMFGGYSSQDKDITLNQFVENEDRQLSEEEAVKLQNLNNKLNSMGEDRVILHERLHESSDKENVYGPGISPEQRAVVCMNDEMAAKATELYYMTCQYQEMVKNGASKEEALKIFDKEPDFKFYQDAIAQGLDPSSKEGKQLMVQGTCDMWQKAYAGVYKNQLVNIGTEGLSANDVGGIVVGDRKEMQKRVREIWDNVGNNKASKELGLPSPGNLSQYVDMNKATELPASIKEDALQEIAKETERKTGLSKEERETAAASLDGKTDKAKKRELIAGLRKGMSKTEQEAAKAAREKPAKAMQKQGENGNNISSIAAQRGNANGM